VAGFAAGLAGGFTMSQFTRLWEIVSRSAPQPLPYSPEEWEAAGGMANAIAKQLLGTGLSRDQIKHGAAVVHYGTAGAAGVIYAMTSSADARRWSGVLLGLTTLLLGNDLLMPALGLTKKPSEYSIRMRANALGEHVVYGVTVDLVYRRLNKLL